MKEEKSQEFLKREFMHWIADVIASLGGKEEIVKLINKYEELPLTEEFVNSIRNYIGDEIDSVKNRLNLIHTISVKRN